MFHPRYSVSSPVLYFLPTHLQVAWIPVPSLYGKVTRKKMETVTDFIFLGSKITADGDCSHEIKRHLFLGREAMINLDTTLKSRDITLPTKVHLVKAMVFPVVLYGCESWTIKKAGRRRTDAFELWFWRRLLRVPLGLQGDPTSPFWRRSALGFLWKEWC